MKRTLILGLTPLLLITPLLLDGCGTAYSSETAQAAASSAEENTEPRDNTPLVMTPSADGTVTWGNDLITVDASHTDQGYIMVEYHGDNVKPKIQIHTPDEDITYTYLVSDTDQYITYPLPCGDGSYNLTLYENVSGDTYANVFSQDFEVTLEDDFLPFLYSNEYCCFNADSEAVQKGRELASDCYSDLDVVSNVYNYVIDNITYDTEKAETVQYGYLPDVDETLETGTGICFDYAALMTSMLRSQQIPTKLEIGYAGDVYHAWISTYVDGIGWIDNVIEFDGEQWEMMDPTFAANSGNDDPVGDGANYLLMYSY